MMTLEQPLKRLSESQVPFINQILEGDNLEFIRNIPKNTIDLVITSPPYFQQRDYGKGMGNEKNIDDYLEHLTTLFHECVRVTKDEGSIIFNIGDKYKKSSLMLIPYRFALKILETESVMLVNNITWIKSNPVPRQFQRRLVNSTEPFFHFVKSNKYYYNLKLFKESKIIQKTQKNDTHIGQKYFELIEKSSLTDFQKQQARKELVETINLIKDGKISGLRMKIKGIHALPFGGQQGGRLTHLRTKGFTIIKINGDSIKKDIIESPVETIKGNIHPAVYPENIIAEFIKLLTKENGIVLDPFVGSGTSAVAAKKLKRKFIGFEINSKYLKYANDRLNKIAET